MENDTITAPVIETPAATAVRTQVSVTPELVTPPLVMDELLVEEISIDGMCGVY